MIYDCFLFFNELELLEIRLHTLDSVVDKFVLCESTKDHMNRPKPLYFAENKEKFKKFKDKIIYIKVSDAPNTKVPWIIIDHQWQAIGNALKKCKPTDIILFSDVDEIPKPERVLEWKNKPGKVKMFMQSLSYYYLNCVDYASGLWEGPRMALYRDIKNNRMYANKFMIPDVKISDGGWHFSYIGGLQRIRMKVASSGHQEFNTEHYKAVEYIKMSMAEGKDFLNMGLKFRIADISFLPKYVQDHHGKFKHLLIDTFESKNPLYLVEKIMLQTKWHLRLLYWEIRKRYNAEKRFFQNQ